MDQPPTNAAPPPPTPAPTPTAGDSFVTPPWFPAVVILISVGLLLQLGGAMDLGSKSAAQLIMVGNLTHRAGALVLGIGLLSRGFVAHLRPRDNQPAPVIAAGLYIGGALAVAATLFG